MSNRTVLLSIDKKTPLGRFSDYAPGIWQITVTKSQDDRNNSFWGDMGGDWSGSLSLVPIIINTVISGESFYPQVFVLEELFQLNTGFYYDFDAQTLYVKFYKNSPWYLAGLITYGSSERFVDQAQWDQAVGLANQSYIDGIYVDPRIMPDSFSYTQTLGEINDNRMTYDDAQITLINSDGVLDHIRENSLGYAMSVYFSSVPDDSVATTLGQFTQSFSGILKRVEFSSPDTVILTGGDPRADWGALISGELLTTEEFPNIREDKVDDYKSIIIGQLYGVPCVDVSGNTDSRTWSVNSVKDGEATLQAVYDDVNGDSVPMPSEDYTYTSSTGVLTLNRDPDGLIRVDILGPEILSPVDGALTYKAIDVAFKYLADYANIPYISSFWDIGDIIKVYETCPDVGVHIGQSGLKLSELLNYILSSVNMRIYIKGVPSATGVPRNLFSIREINHTHYKIMTEINPIDLLTVPIPWGFDEDSVFSKIAVNYNPFISSNNFKTYRDSTYESQVIESIGKSEEYVYRSYCSDISDIKRMAKDRYLLGTLAPYRLHGSSAKELEFSLFDFIWYHHKRFENQILNNSIWVVTEINRIDRTFELSLVEEYDKVEAEMFVGEVTWWPGAENIPDGKLLCDGSTYAPTEYPDLFAAIGTTWGGDGVSSFAVPDIQGIFPGATGTKEINGVIYGPDGEIGSYQADNYKSHGHSFTGTALSGNARQLFADNLFSSDGILSLSQTSTQSMNEGGSRAVVDMSISLTPAGTISTAGGNESRPASAMGRWIIAATPATPGGATVNTYKDWIVKWTGVADTILNTWGAGRFALRMSYIYLGIYTESTLVFNMTNDSIDQFESAATDQAGSDSIISIKYNGATSKEFEIIERGSDFSDWHLVSLSMWELVTP